MLFLSCRFDGDDFEDETVKDPQWGEDEMEEDDIDVDAAAAADGVSFWGCIASRESWNACVRVTSLSCCDMQV